MGRQRRAGFTLIEILAVIMIIAVLSAVLISQLGGERATNVSLTKTFLGQLGTIIEAYEIDHGRYPPSSFTPEQGVPNDGENVGVEALVVALYSNKWNAGGHEIDAARFGNTDEDLSARSLTDHGNRKLLELVDLWDNPIAYIYRTDYGQENRVYVTLDEQSLPARGTPQAWKDPLKGQYYKHDRFQLISAGPNGVFDNDSPESDDITNFDRQ